jgi:hypothetical protein
MKTSAIFLAVGVAAIFAVVASTMLTLSAYAKEPNEKFSTDCDGPGQSGGDGDCRGESERSGPHDEKVTNPGGNEPPGLQEDDD